MVFPVFQFGESHLRRVLTTSFINRNQDHDLKTQNKGRRVLAFNNELELYL